MAGHSQFKNIMHRKGAQDKKRGKIFTKLAREITVAAKISDDLESNPRLRSAIQAARAQNMPKDNIDRAIKKASGGADADQYDEMRYEGYGPHGIALMIEVLTNNRNRSASEIRSILSKHGGNLAETGAVSFLFHHLGRIVYDQSVAKDDEMFELALEAGADQIEQIQGFHIIETAVEDFSTVLNQLIDAFGHPQDAKLAWKPLNFIQLDDQANEKIMKLVDILEDNDDVQNVFTNME